MSTATIALTFDDGPDPVWTPAVLDALDELGASATFFVIAPLAEAHPQLIARMYLEGHAVGLHCHAHVRHSDLGAAAIAQDTDDALATLDRLDVRPTVWRTPWGIMTDATRQVARDRGLRLVHWTADTEDWAGHDPQAMLDRVTPGLGPGSIVLAHDGLGPGATRDGCADTVALIAPLVRHARELGLEPATLDDASLFTR